MEYLSLKNIPAEKANALIKGKLKQDSKLTITEVNSMHNVGVGLFGDAEIVIEDNTGLYTCSFLEGPKVRVKGNVGWYAGDDMMDGELIIEKNTGCNVGAYINGGTIVIYGSTGSRVGYGMKGGNIIVCGSAGAWSAQMATGGNLIVLGKIGIDAGESMYRGAIFSRDPELKKKIGGNVFVDLLTKAEQDMLKDLFEKYQIDAEVAAFSVVRPMKTGRHQYEMFTPDLKPERAKKYEVKGNHCDEKNKNISS